MGADGGDAALLEERDPVGEHDRRRAVGHDERGRRGEHAPQRRLDLRLGGHVERRERVVEHEHRGGCRDRTREREPLALPAREAHALFADLRVDAVGQVVGEARLCDAERLGEHALGLGSHLGLIARELGPAEQHVVAHRRREQRRVLERHRDVRAELLARERADVDAVERHRSRGHVVEPGGEGRHRGLARAGEPDEGHRLARFEGQVDAVEEIAEPFGRVLIAEVHAREGELAPRPLDRDRSLGVGDRVLAVEDVEESVGRGARVDREREQEPDRLDRPGEHRRRREERDEVAVRERALRGEPHAEHEADGERDRGHHEDPRPDARVEPRLLHLGAAQRLGLGAEVRERVLAAAECLQHADAVHRLLDRRGEVARLVLAPARHLGVAALEAVADDPERDGADEEDEPEHPVHRHEDDEADDDHDEVHDEQHEPE